MSEFQDTYPTELLNLSSQPPQSLMRLAREALLVRLYEASSPPGRAPRSLASPVVSSPIPLGPTLYRSSTTRPI